MKTYLQHLNDRKAFLQKQFDDHKKESTTLTNTLQTHYEAQIQGWVHPDIDDIIHLCEVQKDYHTASMEHIDKAINVLSNMIKKCLEGKIND